MPWAGQTWFQLLQESTYGVYNSGGATIYPVLFNGNAFTVRRVPQRQILRTADAGNRRKQVVANRRVFTGTLNTLLYPTQAAYWATMFTLGTDSNGYITPPSYTAQYWDSQQAWRLTGGKPNTATITSVAETDYVTLSLQWVFQDRDNTFTTFPQPLESVYPTETPYQHHETASNCTIAGTAFTQYKNITISLKNTLAGTWNEAQTISYLYYCGRDLDFQFGPEYVATAANPNGTTFRTDFEQQTPLSFVLEWIRASPAHSLTFQCNSSAYMSTVDDDLPLDGPGYQAIGVEVFYDKTSNSDFAVSAT